MYTEWTRHLKTQEEKVEFEKRIISCRDVLDRQRDIISEWEKTLDRSETSIDIYDRENWDYRQAHKNGNRETLANLKKLVDLDQQRTNTK